MSAAEPNYEELFDMEVWGDAQAELKNPASAGVHHAFDKLELRLRDVCAREGRAWHESEYPDWLEELHREFDGYEDKVDDMHGTACFSIYMGRMRRKNKPAASGA